MDDTRTASNLFDSPLAASEPLPHSERGIDNGQVVVSTPSESVAASTPICLSHEECTLVTESMQPAAIDDMRNSVPATEPLMADPVVEYPALPRLGSALAHMVFSHKSVYGSVPHVHGQCYTCQPRDNERLTFVGSAALQLCVSRHLYEKHPQKVVGYLSQLRSYLVSKEMLVHWAKQYDMPAQLLAHESAVLALRENPNVVSGLFEAFIGALTEAHGYDATLLFVGELIDAQLAVQPEQDVAQSSLATVLQNGEPVNGAVPGTKTPLPSSTRVPSPGSPPNRLSVLNERASQLGKTLAWSEVPQGPEYNKSWKMVVSVDGVVMGEGLGDRKQIAKIAAAEKAWEALGWQ